MRLALSFRPMRFLIFQNQLARFQWGLRVRNPTSLPGLAVYFQGLTYTGWVFSGSASHSPDGGDIISNDA
jgi:hypothetical protein